jgi:hypothetical protein
MAAPFVVQDVPEAAVPLEHMHEFDAQELPVRWKPVLQPAQILTPSVVQDDPVAAVPAVQLHEFCEQALLLKW